MKNKLRAIYYSLLRNFGSQEWWPAKSQGNERKFEICIGAILTQNTSWKNAERAIEKLRKNSLLNSKALGSIGKKKLASLIKPAGYYNQKSKKVKAFAKFIEKNGFAKIEAMPVKDARQLLLNVHGIGDETADSILLYALNKPIFVVDGYTKRIFERLLNLRLKRYKEWQEFFHSNLKNDVRVFNEYHALLVELGKNFCRKKPRCNECPLNVKCFFVK